MTREDKIEELQDKVSKNCITNIEELNKYEPEIDVINEVLSPMGFNICDRCGKCGDGELDFLWVDYFPWDKDDKDDKSILKAIEIEGVDYCALCWDCVDELKKKGAKACGTE